MVCGVSRLGPLFCNRAPASVRGCSEAGALGEDRWGLETGTRPDQVREGGKRGNPSGGGW